MLTIKSGVLQYINQTNPADIGGNPGFGLQRIDHGAQQIGKGLWRQC